MSEPNWKKGSTVSGKYPEKPFSAVLKAIYPGLVGKEDKRALKLDFEGDIQLAIFGTDQVKEDCTVPAFMDIGKFLDSLSALKLEYFWAFMDGEVTGFKTQPDLVGCKLFMRPEERKGDVGSKYEGQTFRSWIVEKYEKATVNPGAVVTETSRPKTQTAAASELVDILPETLKTEMSIKEIYEFLNKKYRVSEIKDVLNGLETDGLVEKKGDKYLAIR